MLHLIEKEFRYAGIIEYCFEYRKDMDWGTAIINVYDDDYIVGYRQYKGKRTNSYLLSSTAHLLSFIAEAPEQWETQQEYCVHDCLTASQLRKLLLNAPVSVTKSLRNHPSYDAVMRQLAALATKVHPIDDTQRLIADITKLIQVDPFRAYGEALHLHEKTETDETQVLLDLCLDARKAWRKQLDSAASMGQDKARATLNDETYHRVSKALRWASQRQGVEKPRGKEIFMMTCDGAALSKTILASRVKRLQSIYGNEMDRDTLETIVTYCDENQVEIDLTQPLSEQFEVEA